jgi:hypothetical protein
MSSEAKSVYAVLSAIDCRKECKKKNGLTYLPWAWAWARVKENFPDATYTIYENKDGLNYHHDGKTAWVKTGVTIQGIELIEDLPVMDFRNASIPIEKLTSFDVNKAIQRSLTKACARHGLGLYIFAGEDLPEGAGDDEDPSETRKDEPVATPKPSVPIAIPTVKKAPQSGSTAGSLLKKKAQIAWCAFKELDSVKTMDENSRSNFFFSTLKSKVGKNDPSKLTAEDWDRVIEELKQLKAN